MGGRCRLLVGDGLVDDLEDGLRFSRSTSASAINQYTALGESRKSSE